MNKELYLYSPIYDFVAQDLIAAMEQYSDEDITLRINSPGGNVFAGWGIIAKMMEKKGVINIKVDGAAMSMASVMLPFADKVEALDVSTIMLHRARGYVENEQDQALLDTVNKTLRSKLEEKIDSKKLKELKGISIKDLFENEKAIDLFLTAKEAKAIGLVDKITTLTSKELTAFNHKMFAIAAEHQPENEPIKNLTMTLKELKEKHPAIYAEAVAEGIIDGVAKEKDRVEACLVFHDVDPAGVKAAIESGKELSAKQMAEFALKAGSKTALKAVAAESAGAIGTGEETKPLEAAEKKKADFAAETRKHLNIGNK